MNPYYQVIQRGWWLIALATLAALNGALIFYLLAVPMYESSASFVVNPTEAVIESRDEIYSLDTLSRRSITATYAEILNSLHVRQSMARQLQLSDETLEEYEMLAVVLPETNVIQVNVQGPDPAVAAAIANSLGEQAINYISQLSRVYDMEVLDLAQPADEPFSPQPVRDIGLAVAIGFFAGIALAFVYTQLRFTPSLTLEPA